MAIAFDATASGDSASSQTSLTYSHTCSGSNRILLVGIENNNNGGDIVSGVTYNSVSMTRINTVTLSTQGQFYLYYLIAPSTGSNNVVISTSSTATIVGRSCSYTGVKQSAQPDASTTDSTLIVANSFTTSITTSADNCWVVMMAGSDHGVLSGGTNATLRTGGSSTNLAIFDTNGPKTPAGSISLTINSTSGISTWGTCLASISPENVASIGNFLTFFE